jgi:hypothetical protein
MWLKSNNNFTLKTIFILLEEHVVINSTDLHIVIDIHHKVASIAPYQGLEANSHI